MRTKTRAAAIAIVLLIAGLATGLAGAPAIAQDDDQGQDNDAQGQDASSSSSSDCPSPADFEVVELHDNSMTRNLLGGEEIIGIANVTAGSPRDLKVHLETSGDELGIEVFEEVDGTCQEFNESSCDQTVTSTTHTDICRLDDPDSGTKSYWVHNTNLETADTLDFHEWAPEA